MPHSQVFFDAQAIQEVADLFFYTITQLSSCWFLMFDAKCFTFVPLVYRGSDSDNTGREDKFGSSPNQLCSKLVNLILIFSESCNLLNFCILDMAV